ncbi:terminase [Escherichia coli]|nr:terminase [Escherichia coli]MCW7305645.1 terminase [Escherichia coli]
MEKRDQWDETPPVQRVTQSIDARLIQLTEKQNKTGGDFKEIDLLTRQLKNCMMASRMRRSQERKAGRKNSKIISRRNRLPHCGKKSSAGWSGISGAGLTPDLFAGSRGYVTG